MPTDRVLIEIMTAANMAGVKTARAGLSSLNLLALGTGLAVAGLMAAGKDAIAISEEHFRAEQNLANAIKNRGGSQKQVQLSLQSFMQTNRDFISNQNDVINSYANLLREGVKSKDLSRLMTIALNIQATQGGTLTDAVLKIQQAEVGRNRGLALAVGLTLKAIPAHATYAQKLKIVEYNLRILERAYRDGTKAVDPLTRATNDLKQDWEKIAEKYGPDLVTQISAVAKEIDKNMPTWEHWLDVLGKVISQVHAALDPEAANKAGLKTHDDIMARLNAIELQLGIAEPAKPADLTAEQKLVANSTPEMKQRRLDALSKGPAAYAAEIKRQEAEQARQLKLIADRLAQGQRDSLKYLTLISEDTRTTAINSKLQPIITVTLDSAQIAAQIRRRDRSLR